MTRSTFQLLTALNGKLEEDLREGMKVSVDDYDKNGDMGAGCYISVLDISLQLTIEKIDRVSSDLARAKFIDDLKIKISKVSIGTIAELLYTETGEVEKTAILGYWDAYLFQKGEYPKCSNVDFIISPNAPITQSILGKKAGDILQIKIPEGSIEVKILSIKKFDCQN